MSKTSAQTEAQNEKGSPPSKARAARKANPQRAKRGKAAKAAKTRAIDPTKLDKYGFRVGSLKSRAAAMYAGKKGATLAEVKEALKSTQFNVLSELQEKGFKIDHNPATGESGRKVTRYHVQ